MLYEWSNSFNYFPIISFIIKQSSPSSLSASIFSLIMAIGETILGSVLAVVFDRLASHDVLNFFKSSSIEQPLVNNLRALMLAAEQLLVDAEEKQLNNPSVKLWLDELKHWFYRAEEVVDEIATEALRSSLQLPREDHSSGTMLRDFVPVFGSSASSFEKSMNFKMREIVSMLEGMLTQKDALGLREREASVSKACQRVSTACLLDDFGVYGRDREREGLLQVLCSEGAERSGIDAVAIVGMGGLGKTTLAKVVYNDERLKERFDLKAWVCVSDDFDIYQVTKSILESITRKSCSSSLDLNFLQVELSGELRGKRFLLVLDDVWNENYEQWECLRIPFSLGANGSKIVVTTRSHEVASPMCTKPVFRLKPLADDDGWSLLSRHAFEVDGSGADPSLELVGVKLVHKCHGLPLAIKALGGLLRSKQDPSEWLAILQSNLWDLPNDKSNLVPALRLSYVHLPSHLKRCFSYCAIFPKDYPIDITKLVLLWMAEGFIQASSSNRRLEDVGNDYVNQLLAKSFFERRRESSIVYLVTSIQGSSKATHQIRVFPEMCGTLHMCVVDLMELPYLKPCTKPDFYGPSYRCKHGHLNPWTRTLTSLTYIVFEAIFPYQRHCLLAAS